MAADATNNAPTIAFLVTEDWYFLSHRASLARAALQRGCRVVLITRVNSHGKTIRDLGIELISLDIRRSGLNFLYDIRMLWRLIRIYRRTHPALVHHVALKPVIFGTLAAWLARVPVVVNAMTGLGFVFRAESRKARWLRTAVVAMMRFLLNRRNAHLIMQNEDDLALLRAYGIARHRRVHLIRGSGVDTERFSPSAEPDTPVTVTLVSRLLWDKGVGEFVKAARILRERGEHLRAVLVGDPDPANPQSVPDACLEQWRSEGAVELWGRRDDIPRVWARSHIAVLPSYAEGLPKSLLEAAACGRPIVTTDAPGCRDVVEDGITGYLVPIYDVPALAEALSVLIQDKRLRLKMGRAGRERVERYFAESRIVEQTTELYRQLLVEQWPG